MPNYSPVVKKHGHVRALTPTCLQLRANQAVGGLGQAAVCGVLARSGWGNWGPRVGLPPVAQGAGTPLMWSDGAGPKAGQPQHLLLTRQALSVAPNPELLRARHKKCHPFLKGDRPGTGWTHVQADPQLHAPQMSRFSADKLQEPRPGAS